MYFTFFLMLIVYFFFFFFCFDGLIIFSIKKRPLQKCNVTAIKKIYTRNYDYLLALIFFTIQTRSVRDLA